MRHGLAGVDHVIVAVRDLERARADWTRLGLPRRPGAAMSGRVRPITA